MTESFAVDLVLTKGPHSLQRRMSLQVPVDGTPVTLGRAPENDVVFDDKLLFASQRHCQLFVRPVGGAMGESEAKETVRTSICNSAKRQVERKRGRDAPELELCLLDLGSSNGTFINGVRVGTAVATPLQHRDVVVFGGMRDIVAGASLPTAAVESAPEIITWSVSLHTGEPADACVATPPVVLCTDFVAAEEKRMALELLRCVASTPARHGPASAMTPPPTVLKRWNEAQLGEGEEASMEKSPQTPAAHPAAPCNSHEKSNGRSEDGNTRYNVEEESTHRCGTVAAQLILRGESVGLTAPSPVMRLRAARVGTHTFLLEETNKTRKKRGQLRRGDTRRDDTCMPHPYTLEFTETHWKWMMDGDFTTKSRRGKVTRSKPRSIVEYGFPWSSVARIMYCTPQCGLIAQLLPNADNLLPTLIELKERHGKEKIDFISWLAEPQIEEKPNNTQTAEADVSWFQEIIKGISLLSAQHKGLEPQPLEEAEFLAHYAPKL